MEDEKKKLQEQLNVLKKQRDLAIGKKFVELNQVTDPEKLKEIQKHNEIVEQALLAEQKKFNDSKIRLEDCKEKLEIFERTIVSSHKKIEAVKRELEKLGKLKRSPVPNKQAPVNKPSIAKTFSNPPPVIQNVKILQNPSNSTLKLGILNFFKRG